MKNQKVKDNFFFSKFYQKLNFNQDGKYLIQRKTIINNFFPKVSNCSSTLYLKQLRSNLYQSKAQ